MSASSLLDRGLLPDWLIRLGIRRLLKRRLREEARRSGAAPQESLDAYVRHLAAQPIAVRTEAANAQHYEVPAAFFTHVLGRRMKYSCALWEPGTTSLDDAEEAMLALTVQRAGLRDGMDILELGCGWGSLTLYMAEHFPGARIQAVSNSHGQRRFIERVCAARGFRNVEIITRDMNDFETTRRFDRVVSVEMLEHMQNYEALFRRIRSWLRPDGRFFSHIFVHKTYAYPFETEGDANWLGRHFFTGGQMPSADLLGRFDADLVQTETWDVNGTHYAKTARAWLENLDQTRSALPSLLDGADAPASADVQIERWRVFFMACEELWNYRGGREWYVQHALFRPRAQPVGTADAKPSAPATLADEPST
jgi:cyclopropane-fatty-acyl-phospholipid synthase